MCRPSVSSGSSGSRSVIVSASLADGVLPLPVQRGCRPQTFSTLEHRCRLLTRQGFPFHHIGRRPFRNAAEQLREPPPQFHPLSPWRSLIRVMTVTKGEPPVSQALRE